MKNVCIGIVLAISCGVPVARAQESASPFIGTTARATDVFLGQNKTGPYPLGWQKLRTDNVTVIVDGTTLLAADYNIDAAKGTITFQKSLKASSMARVDYDYDPAVALRNASFVTTPVTLPLLQMRGGGSDASLQVTALPGDGKNGTGTRLVWGLGGKTSLLGGGLTSQLLLAPDASSGEGGLWDRAGVKLGYGLGDAKNRVDLSFSRGGRAFAPGAGKALGMSDTSQRWSLGGKALPAQWLAAEFSFGESRNLTDKGGSGSQNNVSLRLWGTGTAPTVNLSRAENATVDAAGASQSVTTEKVGITGKLGTSAFAAQGQRVVTDGPTPGSDQTRQEITASLASVSKDKRAQASLVVRGGTVETNNRIEEQQGVEIKLQPTPTLTLSGETRQKTVTVEGADDPATSTYQAASAELKPSKVTRLVGTVKVTGVGSDRTAVSEVGAELQPLGFLDVNGGVTRRSETGNDLLDSQRIKLTLRPATGISVTGSLFVNPEEKGTVFDATRQELGLAAKMGAIEIGGGYSLTSWAEDASPLGGTQTGELSLNLGLRFSRYTSLTGGYKDALVYGGDPQGLRIYSLSLAHNLGSALNFSLGGSLTENKGTIAAPTDVKAEAKLGIKF